MARHPLFLDDPAVALALDEAAGTARARLALVLPELAGEEGQAFEARLRAHLAAMLQGEDGAPRGPAPLPPLIHGDDAFGHPFDLDDLPLPRAGSGYAVQLLDTDTLLDRRSGDFLAVRDTRLQGLFDSFADARAAARSWLAARGATVDTHPLAIVPASYDPVLERHVLIYGVLRRHP